jgi:hypothetical protein
MSQNDEDRIAARAVLTSGQREFLERLETFLRDGRFGLCGGSGEDYFAEGYRMLKEFLATTASGSRIKTNQHLARVALREYGRHTSSLKLKKEIETFLAGLPAEEAPTITTWPELCQQYGSPDDIPGAVLYEFLNQGCTENGQHAP